MNQVLKKQYFKNYMTVKFKITVPFENLKTVAHISDIHIRLFKRHEEYRDSFNTLYNQLRHKNLLNDGIIVVAGDVVHAKTDMSPEMLQLASEFLSSLANIAPTIVIAGNHDLNLANVHRLDALTPIIDNLQNPNLHYLKRSGIYQIADVDFAVHSVLDDKSLWPLVDQCTTKTKVALYHGPVYGALTDGNYTITDRHVYVDMFTGYDIVMLGDIHKYQILQERDEEKLRPVVVYSSSLIQQNHGESLTGHGWCLWDIATATHQFKELPNQYGYYTLEAIDGRLSFPNSLPNNVRLRLFTGDADESLIKKMVSSIRKKYNVIELSVNRTRYVQVNKKQRVDLLDFGDLTNVDIQNSLIDSWLKTAYGKQISNKLAKKILDINKKLNGEIHHEDQSRGVHWKPLELRFSNIFSYGEDNVIRFDSMSGTYGIFAPNASGKSSSMDALIFALFDKTPRAFKGSDIMNNRKSDFDVQLIFEINGSHYVIRRRGTRKKNGAVKVVVDFLLINADGSFTSLNGAERSDTNANIRSLIGSYEDFILTALSGQTSNSLFIDKSHSERKDLLNQFMGLTIFDKLQTRANDLSKEVQGALRKFKGDDFTQSLADVQIDLDNYITNKQILEDQRNIETEKLQNLDKLINDLYHKKLPIDGDVIDLESEESKVKEFGEKIDSINKQIAELQGNIVTIENKLNKLPPSIYSETDVSNASERITKINKNLSKLSQKITKEQTLYNTILERVSWLDTHEYDENCTYCVNNIFFKSALREKEEMLQHKTAVQNLEEEQKVLFEQLSKEEELLSVYKESVLVKTESERLSTSKLKLELELQQKLVSITSYEKAIIESESKITKYRIQENAIVHNESIDVEIQDYKNNKDNIVLTISDLDKKLREIYAAIEVCKTKKEEFLRKLSEAEELELEYEGYKYYMDAVGRDGVPYELMTKIIPSIESEINNILTQVVDFTVSLTVDDKNINGKIVYDYERLWPLENSSGMERFITSLAIRVALMKASNLPKPNFLILDEGMGTLDADNLTSMSNLFTILKTQFDFVIIISHLDTVRDMVDYIIELKKEDGYSFIQYV